MSVWSTKLLFLASGEASLLEELWNYFAENYFNVYLGAYENLNFGSGSLITVHSVVLGLFGGIIAAAALALYDHNVLGSFVRTLIREGCLSPEDAKPLWELGFAKNGAVKASLRSQSKLGRVVHCVEKEAYEREVAERRAAYVAEHGDDKDFSDPAYRIDFENDHFYIPDEDHYRAEIRFENKGSGWFSFILVTVLCVIAAFITYIFLPDILQLLDNAIGMMEQP